ncbi:MAG: M28 family peptidase [Flavobacteriales bacterium]|jgi:glutaminyl-peptide cyclotransferase|nr:M28 family peptidase [Flavobacteriales bacterium]
MKILNLLLISIILLASCSNNKTTNVSKGENIKTKISIPNFNSDSSYSFIKKQVDFGPRVISTKAWNECSKYLVDKLNSYNAFVKVQEAPVKTYDGKEHVLRNIIASFSVEKNNRIALFAHWDSRHIADHDSVNTKQPILGANDGGSGVGVLLEIARNLNNQNPNIGVDIILFDAEDYGQPENSQYPIMNDSWCLGSQYWSKNPHIKNYYAKYGILLDMVGGENARFRYEGTSEYYASDILKKVWDMAHKIGYSDYFIFKSSPQIMDDHYYVNTLTGIPTIDIIEFDQSTKTNFNKHWHTHADNMNNVNRKTLKAVGQTVLNVIYTE